MAAKYDFKTSPDIQGEKEQPTLYPQIVVSGTKNLKDLAKDIARRSTVHEGTVVGLLCDLESIIANYLADGYNVKLGELGTFSATLTCRKVTDKSEIRAASVHFDNIKFKPTRKFRKGSTKQREAGTGGIWFPDLLHPIFSRRTLCTADKLSERALHYHLQGILCLDRVAENKSRQRTTPMEQRKENRKKRTRPARDIQGDAGRLKRYPFTCFPPLPEPLFFPGAAGGYEIRPQQNQRHTEPLPYVKSHIRLFGNLRILHKLQSKASAKEYKQAYSGY